MVTMRPAAVAQQADEVHFAVAGKRAGWPELAQEPELQPVQEQEVEMAAVEATQADDQPQAAAEAFEPRSAAERVPVVAAESPLEPQALPSALSCSSELALPEAFATHAQDDAWRRPYQIPMRTKDDQ